VSEIREAISDEFSRLRAIWPGLNRKPEVLAEVGKAVMAHADKLTPEDVARGFDAVIQASPTSGWPPGPHEVVGCVLAAAGERRENERTARRRDDFESMAPARYEVAGPPCSCGSPVVLLRDERALYCDACRRVIRMNLAEWEVDDLTTTRKGAPPGGSELGRDALARMKQAPVAVGLAGANDHDDLTAELQAATDDGDLDEW
jgi:hypothetical protein